MIRTLPKPSAELEAAALASAGRRYLMATRAAAPDDYDRIEAEAWEELLRAFDRLGRPLLQEVQA